MKESMQAKKNIGESSSEVMKHCHRHHMIFNSGLRKLSLRGKKRKHCLVPIRKPIPNPDEERIQKEPGRTKAEREGNHKRRRSQEQGKKKKNFYLVEITKTV